MSSGAETDRLDDLPETFGPAAAASLLIRAAIRLSPEFMTSEPSDAAVLRFFRACLSNSNLPDRPKGDSEQEATSDYRSRLKIIDAGQLLSGAVARLINTSHACAQRDIFEYFAETPERERENRKSAREDFLSAIESLDPTDIDRVLSPDPWLVRDAEGTLLVREQGPPGNDFGPVFDRLARDPATWDFWRRWLEGYLTALPMDHELQTMVQMSVREEDWEKGAAHVAGLIRTIEAEHRTRVAPPLVRDEGAGVFRINKDPPVDEDSLKFARDAIALALDTALASQSANGFDENAVEAIGIRLTLERHPHDASLLAVGLFGACLSLEKNLGDLYPQDTSLINLRNILYSATEEICEQSETAQTRCARLAELHPKRPVSPQDREAAPEIAEAIAGELDAEAQRTVRGDANVIATSQSVPRFILARFTNYVTTVATWIDKAKKAEVRAEWLMKQVARLIDRWQGPGEG